MGREDTKAHQLIPGHHIVYYGPHTNTNGSMVADMSLKQLQGSGLCGHCTWKEHGGHWDRESSSLSIGESELYLGITVNMNLLVMPGDIGNILNILSF